MPFKKKFRNWSEIESEFQSNEFVSSTYLNPTLLQITPKVSPVAANAHDDVQRNFIAAALLNKTPNKRKPCGLDRYYFVRVGGWVKKYGGISLKYPVFVRFVIDKPVQ